MPSTALRWEWLENPHPTPNPAHHWPPSRIFWGKQGRRDCECARIGPADHGVWCGESAKIRHRSGHAQQNIQEIRVFVAKNPRIRSSLGALWCCFDAACSGSFCHVGIAVQFMTTKKGEIREWACGLPDSSCRIVVVRLWRTSTLVRR
jgi:hypothetical protein